MLDWFGPAEVAWFAWGGYALWQRYRPIPDAPVVMTSPIEAKQAMLLNALGRLDSVRTLIGEPPPAIQTARATYHLDRTISSDHWMYRAHV